MSRIGEEINGKLGFGLMRLPMIEKNIDIEQTKKMVDMFMDAGYTYFDTAWAYGGSEDAIRQALVERYPRESFQIASKNAPWIKCKTPEEGYAQLETSLKQAGVEYFDYYLLHNLGSNRTHVFDDFDMYNWALERKAEGKFKHLGFSAHASAAELEEIIKAHPEMEFVQLQINYADLEDGYVQARACYEVARKYDLPIIVMEPVKGGLLANPPQIVKDVFDKTGSDLSYAGWALQYTADLEGIMVVLSGMSNIEQMEDNLSVFDGFEGLTDEQRAVIKEAGEAMASIPIIPCTTCKYCEKVCPKNVGIAGSFTAMNTYTVYGDMKRAKGDYGFQVKGAGRDHAVECIKCGACEKACPQSISIMENLDKVVDTLIPDKKAQKLEEAKENN